MELIEAAVGRDEWNQIVGSLSGLSLMQVWEYGQAKEATGPWKSMRVVLRDDGRTVAAAQGMFRSLPLVGGGLLWINRGPLLLNGFSDRFQEALGAIASWATRRGWYVRLAPPVAAGVMNGDSLETFGFRRAGMGGWCSSVVDLNAGLERVRARLDQKWRNQLGKATRSGVTVDASSSRSSFSQHIVQYAASVARKGFATTVTPEFLTALQECLPEERKMITFTAMHEGKEIGSNLIAVYGDTAEYISGVVEEAGRRLNAGNALLWNAVAEMQKRGFRRFDLGGMHPTRTPKGIYSFKEGLRGTPYCLEDEVETTAAGWRNALIRWRVNRSRQEQSG